MPSARCVSVYTFVRPCDSPVHTQLLELTQALRARPVDSGYDDDRTSAAIKLMVRVPAKT